MSDGERPRPVVPVGGGVPFDPETGERFGWLPRRAAERKLVIRARLGLGWVLGALAAAAGLALTAVVFVGSRPDRPGPPYVEVGRLAEHPAGGVRPLPGGIGWLDRRQGLRAFAGPLAFCPADGGWVGPDGSRFDAAGRAVAGPGLRRLPVRAARGRLYVDPTGRHLVPGRAAPMAACPDPARPGTD